MRPIVLAVTGFAAVLSIGALPDRASAAALGSPGLIGAADELALVQSVHCRPGRWHHVPTRWRRANGCPRVRGGSAVIVVPGRARHVIREGVRVRAGTGGARVRTETTIRSGGGETRATTRSGSTSGRSTTGGEKAAPQRGSEGGRQAPAQQPAAQPPAR